MSHLQSVQLKSWTSFTFYVSLLITLVFIEGIAFGGYTLVAVSHEGATVAMTVVCFLFGAHLRLFVHSKKMFWVTSVAIVSISEIVAVRYLEQEDVFLVCFLIVAFCVGIFLSQTKRCWFTH